MEMWSLQLPVAITEKVEDMSIQTQFIEEQLVEQKQFHYQTRYQTLHELQQKSKDFVDVKFKSSISKEITEFSSAIDGLCGDLTASCVEIQGRNRKLLDDAFAINKQLPSAVVTLQDLQNRQLYPTMAFQANLAKKLVNYHGQAKNIAQDVQKMLRQFQQTIKSKTADYFAVKGAIDARAAKLGELQTFFGGLLQQAAQQNVIQAKSLDNLDIKRLDQVEQSLAAQIQNATNRFFADFQQDESLHFVDMRQFEDLLAAANQLHTKRLEILQQGMNRMQEHKKNVQQSDALFNEKYQLAIDGFRKEIQTIIDEINGKLEKYYTKDSKLIILGRKVTEAQRRWQQDVENFKKIYIESKLKVIYDQISQVFEGSFTADSANVLQKSQRQYEEIFEKTSFWSDQQFENNRLESLGLEEVDQKLRKAFQKCIELSTGRVSGLTQIQQKLGFEVHELLNQLNALIDHVEFEQHYQSKLSKAEVEGAFQVRTQEDILLNRQHQQLLPESSINQNFIFSQSNLNNFVQNGNLTQEGITELNRIYGASLFQPHKNVNNSQTLVGLKQSIDSNGMIIIQDVTGHTLSQDELVQLFNTQNDIDYDNEYLRKPETQLTEYVIKRAGSQSLSSQLKDKTKTDQMPGVIRSNSAHKEPGQLRPHVNQYKGGLQLPVDQTQVQYFGENRANPYLLKVEEKLNQLVFGQNCNAQAYSGDQLAIDKMTPERRTWEDRRRWRLGNKQVGVDIDQYIEQFKESFE